MSKVLTTLVLFVSLIFFAAVAQAAVTIHVTEVDAGLAQSAVEVSTPWGNYVAIDEGGGTYWVGTYSDYEHARVTGILKDLGYRVSSVQQPGYAGTFAQRASLHAQVGNTNVDSITPSIDFDSSTGSQGTKWVDVTWTASGQAGCVFYAPVTHKTYLPSRLDTSQPPFVNESFVMPRSLLTKPLLLIFLNRAQKPAMLPIKSIAQLDYTLTSDALHGIVPDARQSRHLKALSVLDPNVASSSVSTAAPQVLRSASLVIRREPYTFKGGTYPWSCTDPNSHSNVDVNLGDDFILNIQPKTGDKTYSITIRRENYALSAAQDSVHGMGVCIVDKSLLEKMAGVAP